MFADEKCPATYESSLAILFVFNSSRVHSERDLIPLATNLDDVVSKREFLFLSVSDALFERKEGIKSNSLSMLGIRPSTLA